MNWTTIRTRLDLYEKLMRLDKPIGILLLLWPTLWALWFSSGGNPNPWVFWVFVLGTVLMRSAGCVINDLADRNFDRHVARTRGRPLATGELSGKEAVVLFLLLSICAFVLVLLLRNLLLVMLSVAALFLAATYPLTKRFFALPQAYLGIAFGFGIPMAFAAHTGMIPFGAWMLLLANVFWAVAYDTEYAMVDREDDLKIGIKTSAITFGRFDVLAVMCCYLAFLAVMGWAGHALRLGWPYFAGLGAAACIMVWHFFLIRERNPARCFQAFLHNNYIGGVIFLGVVCEYLLSGRSKWWPF